MTRSHTSATPTAMNWLLLACCAVFAATAAVETLMLDSISHARKAERVEMASADARTAFAHCGAYDVLVIGHDAFSADDARKAAFSYFDDHCDVGTGRPKA
jgi:hypothetical protein